MLIIYVYIIYMPYNYSHSSHMSRWTRLSVSCQLRNDKPIGR